MKVLTSQPIQFQNNDQLDAEDLNYLWQYAQDAVLDVGQRRFAECFLPMQFVETLATPYSSGMAGGAEELTYRFICPVTCIVVRGFFHGNLTSTAEVQVNITLAAGGTPSGCTVPFLSTKGALVMTTNGTSTTSSVSSDGVIAGPSTDVIDSNQDKFILLKGTEILITVSGASFTLNRFDVTLHIATDRWTPDVPTSIPSFTPTLLRDVVTTNHPSVVTANNSALATTAAGFASNLSAPLPAGFVRHQIPASTSFTFTIPRFDSARAISKIVRGYLFVQMATTAGTTVTATITGGNVITANVAGLTQVSASLAFTDTLSTAVAGVSATPASDHSVTIANGAGAVCVKAWCLLWFARA